LVEWVGPADINRPELALPEQKIARLVGGMNRYSGPTAIVVFAGLVALVVLQLVGMVQRWRVGHRLDELISHIDVGTTVDGTGRQQTHEDGCLVWALTDEPGTLNPLTRRVISADWVVWRHIFEGLLDYDYDSIKLEPFLAESYELSEDGRQITFRLREGVHFSDGVPITADDVIFTYETIINPGVDAAHLAGYYRDVERVEKLDDRTVRFVLKQPYWKSLEFMGLQDVGVLPRHVYRFEDPSQFNKMRSEPVGSGPYVFEKWDVGREIVLRRNENYWGRKPRLRKIIFRIITNEWAAIQALRSGEVDFVRPLPEQFAELSQDKDFASRFWCLSYFTPKIPYFYIGWNNDSVFFEDRRVRLAMTHLIDREAIIEHLLRGQGRVTSGPFYIYGGQCDPNIKPWPYDPQRGEQLLTEAGWVDTDGDGIRDKDGRPFKFRLMIRSDDVFYERLGKFIKESLAGAGVEVELERFEWSIFIERLLDHRFEAEISGWGGAVEDDPYQLWHSSQIAGRGSNHVGFRNKQADELIERARRILDEEQRNRLYHRLHAIIHNEQPYTFLYARPEMRFLNRRFKNVIVHKLDLNWLEWYVPKEKQR